VSCPANESDASTSGGPHTVYTLRFTTSFDRGSALDEPLCGINVCLISKDGRGILHRVSPINDPYENAAKMEAICKIATSEVGADCSLVTSGAAPQWPGGKSPTIKPRFQEGSVDEVSFLAPELGNLAAIMVAPEGGSWTLDEVSVCSSRTNHTDRFVCRKRLGGRKGDLAAYLMPVPPGAVVYGSGDSSVILSKEQAAALHAIGMSDYSDMKGRLLLLTALLTVGGSGIAGLWHGLEAAIPFALGGMAGLAYQFLLQLGADAAVPSAATSSFSAANFRAKGNGSSSSAAAGVGGEAGVVMEASFEQRVKGILGSTALRLVLVTVFGLAAAWSLQGRDGAPEAADLQPFLALTAADMWQLGVGALGFMMYKVALLGVTLTPKEAREPAHQLEKN